MKKTLIALTCGLALALSASAAQAVTINDDNYLGSVSPGTPSSSAAQITYINWLIGMAVNTTDPPPPTPGDNVFVRSDEPCGDLGGCPLATDGISDQTPSGTVNVTGWEWLYVKYGGDAHVWYVGNLSGNISVPLSNTGGQGQSHYALYNATTTQVPDGGATLGLLGLGMLGLGYLRRRKQQQ
jgi:hypothetical protein